MLSDVSIRVINLDRSVGRLASMASQLDALGLVWDRIPAIAPTQDQAWQNPTYNRNRARALFNRDLKPAEIGCFLSHIAAMNSFVDSKASFGLVLEDDTVLTGDAIRRMQSVVNFLGHSGAEWHCVNLASRYRKRRRHLARFDGFDLYRAYYFPILTAALLWNKVGAKAFLASVEAEGIFAPVDEQLRHFMTKRGIGLFADPCLIDLAQAESTIQMAVQTSKTKQRLALSYLRLKAPLYVAAGIRQFIDQ